VKPKEEGPPIQSKGEKCLIRDSGNRSDIIAADRTTPDSEGDYEGKTTPTNLGKYQQTRQLVITAPARRTSPPQEP